MCVLDLCANVGVCKYVCICIYMHVYTDLCMCVFGVIGVPAYVQTYTCVHICLRYVRVCF